MKDARRLIARCKRLGVRLEVDDGRLVVGGPLTAELCEDLRTHGDAIKRLLLAERRGSLLERLARVIRPPAFF